MRDVSIVHFEDGMSVAQINQILFMGKQHIAWNDVEEYLKRYVGELYIIAESKDVVYIGKDLPDEYTNSNDSIRLKGALAKAKANAAIAIPEMIQISTNKYVQDNFKDIHSKTAKRGWYRFDTRFAIPISDNKGTITKFNVYKGRLIVRCADDGKNYLYDVINIKKETEYTA